MAEKKQRLSRFYEECAAYFDEMYAPEKKVYVFGDGNPEAAIALIGEAPGEQETLLGKPFVGKAGKNLDEFLRLTNFSRAELFITNIVKFRPVKISEKGRASNRPPTREEMGLFRPWLLRELDLVQPKLIVTLGNVPLHAMLGTSDPIGQKHGTLCESEKGWVFPLYHPASVIYNRNLKEVYEQDVLRLAQEAKRMGLV